MNLNPSFDTAHTWLVQEVGQSSKSRPIGIQSFQLIKIGNKCIPNSKIFISVTFLFIILPFINICSSSSSSSSSSSFSFYFFLFFFIFFLFFFIFCATVTVVFHMRLRIELLNYQLSQKLKPIEISKFNHLINTLTIFITCELILSFNMWNLIRGIFNWSGMLHAHLLYIFCTSFF